MGYPKPSPVVIHLRTRSACATGVFTELAEFKRSMLRTCRLQTDFLYYLGPGAFVCRPRPAPAPCSSPTLLTPPPVPRSAWAIADSALDCPAHRRPRRSGRAEVDAGDWGWPPDSFSWKRRGPGPSCWRGGREAQVRVEPGCPGSGEPASGEAGGRRGRLAPVVTLCPTGRGVWQPPAPRGAGPGVTVRPPEQGHRVRSEDVSVPSER